MWRVEFFFKISKRDFTIIREMRVQMNLDLRNCDLKKNLDLRVIVATTDFLVHKLFDLRKIFFQKPIQFLREI